MQQGSKSESYPQILHAYIREHNLRSEFRYESDNPDNGLHYCILTIRSNQNEKCFKTKEAFKSKQKAKQAAAKIACIHLGLIPDSPLLEDAKDSPITSPQEHKAMNSNEHIESNLASGNAETNLASLARPEVEACPKDICTAPQLHINISDGSDRGNGQSSDKKKSSMQQEKGDPRIERRRSDSWVSDVGADDDTPNTDVKDKVVKTKEKKQYSIEQLKGIGQTIDEKISIPDIRPMDTPTEDAPERAKVEKPPDCTKSLDASSSMPEDIQKKIEKILKTCKNYRALLNTYLQLMHHPKSFTSCVTVQQHKEGLRCEVDVRPHVEYFEFTCSTMRHASARDEAAQRIWIEHLKYPPLEEEPEIAHGGQKKHAEVDPKTFPVEDIANYRQLLNIFMQKTTGQDCALSRYECNAMEDGNECTLDLGEVGKFKQKLKAKKKDVQEATAKLACLSIGLPELPASPKEASQQKLTDPESFPIDGITDYVTLLSLYLQKAGFPALDIQSSPSGNGFVSCIQHKALGDQKISGDEKKNKRSARRNAAEKACRLLDLPILPEPQEKVQILKSQEEQGTVLKDVSQDVKSENSIPLEFTVADDPTFIHQMMSDKRKAVVEPVGQLDQVDSYSQENNSVTIEVEKTGFSRVQSEGEASDNDVFFDSVAGDTNNEFNGKINLSRV